MDIQNYLREKYILGAKISSTIQYAEFIGHKNASTETQLPTKADLVQSFCEHKLNIQTKEYFKKQKRIKQVPIIKRVIREKEGIRGLGFVNRNGIKHMNAKTRRRFQKYLDSLVHVK